MLRQEKEAFVDEVSALVEQSAGLLFVDFTGMNVAEQTDFRVKMREAKVTYRVVKNTLMLRALEKAGIGDAESVLKGAPTGVVFGQDDPVGIAKAAVEFRKGCGDLKIKGAVLEHEILDAKGAEALSKMPGRQEMLSEIVGLILGSGSNLQGLLKGPAGRLLGAVESHATDDS